MADQSNVIMALLGQLLGGQQRGLPPLSQMMRGQQVLPGLYDPTGISFEQPGGGSSSELGGIHGGGPNPYFLAPSLVPGQKDIEGILGGKYSGPNRQQMNPEQVMAIINYAKSRWSEVPKFSTLDEAEAYENKRHEGLDQGYMPNPRNPQDILSWILSAVR